MFNLYSIYDFVSKNSVSILAHRTDEEAIREFKLGLARLDPVHAESLELIKIGVFNPLEPSIVNTLQILVAEGADFVKEVE